MSLHLQSLLDLHDELVVDLFAGGGGASSGIEQALGRMVDIAMRMLQPRELYLCQGFRPGYIIDRGADGRILTKTEQVRMVGNSVSPPVAEALVRANAADLIVRVAA